MEVESRELLNTYHPGMLLDSNFDAFASDNPDHGYVSGRLLVLDFLKKFFSYEASESHE